MATTYGTTTSITCTVGTLASSATVGRESASITTDTSNNVNDYRISVAFRPNGAPTGVKAMFCLVKTYDGTTWDGNATASDAAITIDSPDQFYFGCSIPVQTTAVTRAASFSLKAACGGSIPKTWGIIIINNSGVAVTTATFAATYTEEYTT